MILEIVKYDNPILRKKGAKVGAITPEVKKLANDMLKTIHDGPSKGIGLAAQQIGQALQLAVIDIRNVKDRVSRMWIDGKPVNPEDYMPLALIDPEISGTKSKITAFEGCLSFPGLSLEISRPQRVTIKTRIWDGSIFEFDAGGLLGRAIQHEYDHLQGRLFIDLLSAKERREKRADIEAIRLGLPLPSAEKE
jgi:peptide deformylase